MLLEDGGGMAGGDYGRFVFLDGAFGGKFGELDTSSVFMKNTAEDLW